MDYAQVYFDSKIRENAQQGKYGERHVPQWLRDGKFEFTYDSLVYTIRAGETVSLPLEVAYHAIRHASFYVDPKDGTPIRPLTLRARLPGGVSDPYTCPICGHAATDAASLANHIGSGHVPTGRTDGTAPQRTPEDAL